METVAIAGVGLLGGSFALALREAGFEGTILGVSSPATLEKALERKAIDEAVSLREAAERADLLYLAQPIGIILRTIEEIGPWLRPETIVTDVGSTKRTIVNAGIERIGASQFLGGHPMAGKETRGIEHADAGLFRGRTYFLTPAASEIENNSGFLAFSEWIHRIGGEPAIISAQEHDRVVAITSHLPQLLSTCLGTLVGRMLPETMVSLGAGPGLEDMLRLAASEYPLWADILETNWDFIQIALKEYSRELAICTSAGACSRLEKPFERAGEVSRRLRHKQF